jgi:hypothetical protein
MESYIPFIIGLPIVWFLISISYHIIKLIGLWLKYKFENIKIKELSLWD